MRSSNLFVGNALALCIFLLAALIAICPAAASDEEETLWKELFDAVAKITEKSNLSYRVVSKELITPDQNQIEYKVWVKGPKRELVRMDYPVGAINMSTVLSPNGGFHHIIEQGKIIEITASEARSAITSAKAQMEVLMSKLPKVDWEKVGEKYRGMHTIEKDDAEGYVRYIYRNVVLINRTDFYVDSGTGALARIVFFYDGKTPTTQTDYEDVVLTAPEDSVFETQVADPALAAKYKVKTVNISLPIPGAGQASATAPAAPQGGWQTKPAPVQVSEPAVQEEPAPAEPAPAVAEPEAKKPAYFNLGF